MGTLSLSIPIELVAIIFYAVRVARRTRTADTLKLVPIMFMRVDVF